MVFRSFSKLHPNGPVPHQISPPNSRFINPVRAFLAFTYLSKSHAWRGSPSWHRRPPLLAGASQPKNVPFQPCGRRVSPIQAASFHLQSGDGECLPATQLYLSVFTCLTVSLDLPSDAGASSPARHAYLFHPMAGEAYPSRPRVFSSGRMLARASWPHNLPFCLYLSNTASLDLPLDAGASSPARQPYLSNLLLDEAYPSDTAILKPQLDVGESLRDRQLSFSILRPARPTQPRCRLTARPSDPLNFAFLSKPIRLGEPRSPDERRQEHSQPDNLIFSSPRSTRLTRPTRRFWNHSRTSARASQPDNLTFPSPELGKVYPSDTAIAEATVGRRREPPSQTITSTPASGMSAKHPDQNFTFPSSPIRHSESWSPVGRWREHSRPDNLAFSSPTLATLTRPTQRVLCPRWASARASQRDDLPLPTWQTRLTR